MLTFNHGEVLVYSIYYWIFYIF